MLVLAVLRQGLDCDFDRLVHIANHDGLVRQMPGHGHCGPGCGLQTVIDSVSLPGPELLGRTGGLAVESGHRVAGKKPGEPLRGRVDSFCVETDARYPTDVGLLRDAMRCTIRHAARRSRELGIPGWRQHEPVTGKVVKKAFSRVRTSKLAKRSPERVAGCLAVCEQYLDRVRDTLGEAGSRDLSCSQRREAERVRHFLAHAERQARQVRRRLLEGEPVPHGEKTFSIFEPHARWAARGKAGRWRSGCRCAWSRTSTGSSCTMR